MTKNDISDLKQAKQIIDRVKQSNRRNAEAKVLSDILHRIDNMINYHETLLK